MITGVRVVLDDIASSTEVARVGNVLQAGQRAASDNINLASTLLCSYDVHYLFSKPICKHLDEAIMILKIHFSHFLFILSN